MDRGVSLAAARRVADAVLYEGYLLYPYRSSATKNQRRWQWGVLVPPAVSEQVGDRAAACSECIVDVRDADAVQVDATVRFLRVRTRVSDGWDDAVPHEVQLTDRLSDLCVRDHHAVVSMPACDIDDGEHRYRCDALDGRVTLTATPLPGPYGAVRLGIRIDNTSDAVERVATRDDAVRRALVAAHALLSLTPVGSPDGEADPVAARFVSSIDPPEWARLAVETCTNEGLFPVLVGEHHDVVLASPIILYDQPEVAPESPGDLFDALEIDEILSLRTLALTDDEKREARSTDPRAAEIIDRVDTMPPEVWQRLHGAIRSMRPVRDDVEPEHVRIGDVDVRVGDRVRLRPGVRRADAYDLFLDGRVAQVDAVRVDAEGRTFLAVTLDDDPAAELHRDHGRHLYFAPDEVEPLRQQERAR